MVLYAVDIKRIDKNTLSINNQLYENYGIDRHGKLFELHQTKPIILCHYGDGIKLVDNCIYDDYEYFYIKSDRNKKLSTFKYQFNPNISLKEIRDVVMRWMYMEMPTLITSTLMGWVNQDMHPINDPNWNTAFVMLDDDETYSIIHKGNSVKIFRSDKELNWMRFNENNEKAIVSFELNRELYGEAYELYNLRKYNNRRLSSYNISEYGDMISRYQKHATNVDNYIGGLV